MPLFSYTCPGCKTSIYFDGTKGELCILKHIRHGEILGEVTGHYNGFGGILEEDKEDQNSFYALQGDGPVSKYEIAQSVFTLEDGEKSRSGRIFNGVPVSFNSFLDAKEQPPGWGSGTQLNKLTEEYKSLPLSDIPPKSGIEAWHKLCYAEASQRDKDSHIISETAPDNGLNYTRSKFL